MKRILSVFSVKKKEVNIQLEKIRTLWDNFVKQLQPELEKIVNKDNIFVLNPKERKELLKILRGVIKKQSQEVRSILMRLELGNSKLCCTKDGHSIDRLKINIEKDIEKINYLMGQLPELLIQSYLNNKKLRKTINRTKKAMAKVKKLNTRTSNRGNNRGNNMRRRTLNKIRRYSKNINYNI